MLASLSGRGYCLPCGVPDDDFPLVPASATPQEFLRIQITWQYHYKWRYFAAGSSPGSLRLVENERQPSLLLTARLVIPGKTLHRGQPFEYQRLRLQVVRVSKSIGMQVVVSDSATHITRNVLEDVVCEVVDR